MYPGNLTKGQGSPKIADEMKRWKSPFWAAVLLSGLLGCNSHSSFVPREARVTVIDRWATGLWLSRTARLFIAVHSIPAERKDLKKRLWRYTDEGTVGANRERFRERGIRIGVTKRELRAEADEVLRELKSFRVQRLGIKNASEESIPVYEGKLKQGDEEKSTQVFIGVREVHPRATVVGIWLEPGAEEVGVICPTGESVIVEIEGSRAGKVKAVEKQKGVSSTLIVATPIPPRM